MELNTKTELKPTTMRLSDEQKQAIIDLATEKGLNQNDTLAMLVESYQLNSLRKTIKDRDKEIETFQTKVTDLIGMYTNSLLINQTSEERMREKLADEISKKELVNANLVGQIGQLKKELEDQEYTLHLLSEDFEKKDEELNIAAREIEKLTAELDKMSGVLLNYQEQINAQKAEISALKQLEEINSSISLELDDAKIRIAELENTLQVQDGKYKNSLEQINFFKGELVASKEATLAASDAMREQHKVDLAVLKEEAKQELSEVKAENKRTLADLKTSYLGEIQVLREQHEKEIKAIREQHVAETRELKAEIIAAKKG